MLQGGGLGPGGLSGSQGLYVTVCWVTVGRLVSPG